MDATATQYHQLYSVELMGPDSPGETVRFGIVLYEAKWFAQAPAGPDGYGCDELNGFVTFCRNPQSFQPVYEHWLEMGSPFAGSQGWIQFLAYLRDVRTGAISFAHTVPGLDSVASGGGVTEYGNAVVGTNTLLPASTESSAPF